MTILVDTHVFLWFILDDPKLPTKAKELLVDPDHDRYLGIASVWEVAIKHGLSKLELKDGLQGFIDDIGRANFQLLTIGFPHIISLSTLPLHHRDPFDRMLIAQAKAEGMHILTADPNFRAYEVPLAV